MIRLSRLLTRRRTFYLVFLLICAGISLRPIAVVERGLELVFVPTRAIVELVVPVRWWRAVAAREAEETLWERAPRARADAERLLADEQAFALPSRPELYRGQRLIHGEVIGRDRDDLDRIVIRVPTTEGIVSGAPVVTGNWYVGRVTSLDAHEELLVHAELVTASGFRVGARVEVTGRFPESVAMVVGGISTELQGEEDSIYLDVHNPLRRGLRADPVFVEERVAFDPRQAELARDFALGQLSSKRLSKGSELMRIEPGLDFESGLFQVIVLAPPLPSVGESSVVEAAAIGPEVASIDAVVSAEEVLELDTFVASHWIATTALTRGDVSRGREGRRLSRGRLGGIESGSAVAFGGHLIGRIGGVGWLTADLLELGDPGVRLAVLARLDGEAQPRPLGEIVSLGRRRSDGRLSFRWICRVDLPGEVGARLAAKLYTGSGEAGVPRGLYVGRTMLPVGRDRHTLIVEQDEEVRHLDSPWVWRGGSRRGGAR